MEIELQCRYGVPVEAAEPRFTLADWDARTTSPDYRWGDVGLLRENAIDFVPPLHVTFVCTNNFVRSPMAANIFAHQIHERGLSDQVRVSSAGTFDDPRWGTKGIGRAIETTTARLLLSHGYPTRHCATKLNADHLGADLVVAAAGNHVGTLTRLGVPAERLRLLRSFDPQSPDDLDIEDPEYNHQIEPIYDAITAALPGLHEWVDKRLADRVGTVATSTF
ncbi:protein tyrosine phosphatase [Mycolicibacterium komossense]|uniref:protein-tyrosine-phosphatase n=2 Tax=Mycolicibacterium komossense TaxID=1779 RepID=A0ABT3CLW1_9MYCO|nr:protein tyrosine phosphatase [Mycolicibacterium komossense]